MVRAIYKELPLCMHEVACSHRPMVVSRFNTELSCSKIGLHLFVGTKENNAYE